MVCTAACCTLQVSRVYYPGLISDSSNARVQQLFGGSCGGVVSFELIGGAVAANKLLQVMQQHHASGPLLSELPQNSCFWCILELGVSDVDVGLSPCWSSCSVLAC